MLDRFFPGYSLRFLIAIKNSALVPETRQQRQQQPSVLRLLSPLTLTHPRSHTNSYRIWNPPSQALTERESLFVRVIQTGTALLCLLFIGLFAYKGMFGYYWWVKLSSPGIIKCDTQWFTNEVFNVVQGAKSVSSWFLAALLLAPDGAHRLQKQTLH